MLEICENLCFTVKYNALFTKQHHCDDSKECVGTDYSNFETKKYEKFFLD